ncbi:hypothetical protein H6F42_07710 [Pseudanabaena sp. FACHB-1998]|uniref:hypothetical protein n=1 Tax=Pseudanabaena sp. FACHB-1998 TaxID=2692858 RepID=UPI0016812821|nr:hypothetical protein [Pseudanabaena sp. FACHB-1998]MBD2176799.1 hypothetical protein [Pseudanabaena sp. FACHB-1998]
MQSPSTYYVIAPINGLRLDFDYRMHSAEVYGCPPNYTPNVKGCPEFRQPYEYLGEFAFSQYEELSQEWKIDKESLQNIQSLQNLKLRDFTCIAFEIDLIESDDIFSLDETINPSFFQEIIDRGERFLDVWRLCLFKPGENFSIGNFGALENGIQAFWIGKHDIAPKFFARKSLRYQLVQEPVNVFLSEFGVIYSDITFRGLSTAAYLYPKNSEIVHNIFNVLRAFRESRDITSWEARFRHLATMAESLAKQNQTERLAGDKLRKIIGRISTHGWELYKNYNSSVLLPPRGQYHLISKRYDEIGWKDENEAQKIVKDLWDNVRNPLAHTITTAKSLNRDLVKDMINMEKIIMTMINGICAAYEVEDLYSGSSIHDILLNNRNNID